MAKFLRTDRTASNGEIREIFINIKEIKLFEEIFPETMITIEDVENRGMVKEFDLFKNGYKTWVSLLNNISLSYNKGCIIYDIYYSKLSKEELIKVCNFKIIKEIELENKKFTRFEIMDI